MGPDYSVGCDVNFSHRLDVVEYSFQDFQLVNAPKKITVLAILVRMTVNVCQRLRDLDVTVGVATVEVSANTLLAKKITVTMAEVV